MPAAGPCPSRRPWRARGRGLGLQVDTVPCRDPARGTPETGLPGPQSLPLAPGVEGHAVFKELAGHRERESIADTFVLCLSLEFAHSKPLISEHLF